MHAVTRHGAITVGGFCTHVARQPDVSIGVDVWHASRAHLTEMKPMQIKGKVAVVTGGASGLGLATVEALLEKGANVVIFDVNADQTNAVVERLGSHCRALVVDVTDERSVQSALQQVLAMFGGLHICINCAGVVTITRLISDQGIHSLELMERILRINVIGTFNVVRLAAELMRSNAPSAGQGERGVIVNTASVSAYEGQAGQVAYAGSKGAVAAMTLPMARDLGPFGIRVNAIAAGPFNTPLLQTVPDEIRSALIDTIPFPKRLGESDDFAFLSVHLVENRYMNGETVRLDGAIRLQPE